MAQPNDFLSKARERIESPNTAGESLTRAELAELVNAWVYDNTAARWTGIGLFNLPDAWGSLKPASATTVVWTAAAASRCAAYPWVDVFFSPPVVYTSAGSTMAIATATPSAVGDCATLTTVEAGGWVRYRVGSGAGPAS